MATSSAWPRPTCSLRAVPSRRSRAEWAKKPQPSNAELFGLLKGEAAQRNEPAAPPANAPPADPAAAPAEEHRLEQTYTIAYIAHAPLEPRAAVAEWSDGKLTVWTGTQRPFGVRGDLAHALRHAGG